MMVNVWRNAIFCDLFLNISSAKIKDNIKWSKFYPKIIGDKIRYMLGETERVRWKIKKKIIS